MRIISGKFRGKHIQPPVGFRARPTTDYARESLFNILSNRIDFESCDILDLFSGTGSITYEFLSRGANSVHLVEMDKKHISFIRKMLGEMKVENARSIHIDVKAYLRTCTARYDLVFADPPYDLPWLEKLPDMIAEAGILKEDGVFIIEHPGRYSFVKHPCFLEHREYGSVNFTFFSQLKTIVTG
ncbi:MAG: 16S rRNA (guanine(966)-N(2))-methyltransferase RsmD [Bacteroidales bacterium]